MRGEAIPRGLYHVGSIYYRSAYLRYISPYDTAQFAIISQASVSAFSELFLFRQLRDDPKHPHILYLL